MLRRERERQEGTERWGKHVDEVYGINEVKSDNTKKGSRRLFGVRSGNYRMRKFTSVIVPPVISGCSR